MAFRTVTPAFAADRARDAAAHARGITKRHHDGVAELLKAAEAPTDANTHLAAVKTWRSSADQRGLFWRYAAMLQIGSGDRPEEVCAQLGFGRTALQQAIRAEDSKLSDFVKFLYRARPTRSNEAS